MGPERRTSSTSVTQAQDMEGLHQKNKRGRQSNAELAVREYTGEKLATGNVCESYRG